MLSRKLTYLAAAWARQWLPTEMLRAHQLRLLRRLLAHAEQRSALYRRKFREAGVTARDLRTVEDLAHFPPLTRDELVDSYPDGIATRPLRDDDVVFRTSGSTGRFVQVAYDPAGNDMLDAIYGRALFSTGYRPWDRIAYFWWNDSYVEAPYERLGLMRKTFLPSDGDPHRQLEMLCRVRPDVIYNFPTSLALVSKIIEGNRPPELAPRVIICHGELMTPESRRYIANAFGCDVFDQYGAQEANRMGWDCEYHDGMHMDVDSVQLEFVKDGRLAAPGEEGEVYVTSLHNMLMPLIRYRLADVGYLDPRPCPCGRGLPLFQLTGGRSDDFIVLPSGRKVSPRVLVPRIERLPGFKQYRVRQLGADTVEVLLVLEPDAPSDLQARIRATLDELLEGEASVQIRPVDTIPLKGSGKLRVVERLPGAASFAV